MSTYQDYENKIATLIPSFFPKLYQEDGQGFIAFVQAYYAWLELQDNPLYIGRHLLEYRDIDTTPEAFILFFKNKYLNNIQFTTASNKRLFIKNSLSFYRAKGTPRAVDLFFRLIYGTNADVYLPGEDVFRLSAAEWVKPMYLEVTHSEDNPDYVGKTITGLTSGSTAFVDRLVRRRINSKYIDIFYISAIVGDFVTNERLTIESDTELFNNPIVIGSLSSAEVITGSESFTVGDTINITSNNGLQGKATVTGINTRTGQVDFTLNEGGWGYMTNSEIIISNSVFSLANVNVTNTTISNSFIQFEKIYQPLANILYGSLAGGTFAANDTIEKYYANGFVAGTGTIISVSTINSTAGTILTTINQSSGALSNLNYTAAFAKQGNVVTATTTTYTDRTASANVVGTGSNSVLILSSPSGSFTNGESVSQATGNGVITSISTNATAAILSLTSLNGHFNIGNTVTGNISGITGNVVSFTQLLGISNTSNTFQTSYGYIYGAQSNTFANLSFISLGNNASFNIGTLAYTESVYLNSDLIAANNTGGVPFIGIVLDGTGSNLASNAYGFAKSPTANINSRLFDALNYTLMNVGSIATLTNLNPGNSYSFSPFVVVLNKFYVGLDLYYYNLVISAASRNFLSGEILEQSITFANSATLTVNNSASTWQPGEYVYQSNGTANIATGILAAQTVTANVGNLSIQTVSGTFVTNSTARVNGLTSGAGANISGVNATAYSANARGIVQSQVNSTYLTVKRISTTSFSNTGAFLTGLTSGANATIDNVLFQNPPESGLNANIAANVITSNGVVSTVSIFDSGFGYLEGEEATFSSEDGTRSGTITLYLGKQGASEGYFKSTKSFLSADKYLFDGDYYQDFSYVVRSPLAFETYSDMLKKVLHLVGTKPFGQVVTSSVTNTALIEAVDPGNVATANVSLFVTATTNTVQFAIGETIYQSNGTANIGFAAVVDKLKAVISIATTNVNFIPGLTIQQPNATSNAVYGYVQAVSANSTVTNVYVANCTAAFNASANVFGPTKYTLAVLPKVRMRFASVTAPANTTLSFAVGENIYQGTVGSQTANGIVLNATQNYIEIRPNSGTFANASMVYGQTSGASANLASYSNTALIAGEVVQLCRTIIYCTGANSFTNGESVYQYRRNPNLSTIQFVNTAVGVIVDKNTTSFTITNRFGSFANNELVYGATSAANSTINKIAMLSNTTATVIAANSSQANVYLIFGTWANGTSLYGNTSNTYANLTTVTANYESFAPSSVLNVLDAKIVNGFFVANSTVNTITGATSTDTATISGLTYEQL